MLTHAKHIYKDITKMSTNLLYDTTLSHAVHYSNSSTDRTRASTVFGNKFFISVYIQIFVYKYYTVWQS